ncbi:MAG: tRNA lysidine(34) synthetase TilS [Flavobacteriales bacterium]|nr:tRNA lysidine(34) synthetase TilS [Flavobacteriales bacterium]MBP9080337.1 tRNA lysidine(34) synthetase TilS [Flavobacteriales bacterium]
MLAEVRRWIRREGLLQPAEPLWVAVSGGVDSMVLLHVLRSLGHPCQVAHVDHGLRGAESDGDRRFVEQAALRLGLPFRSVNVDVQDAKDGRSLQMAARDLRYAWFKELLNEGPDTMALGHHRDDAVETLLLNLLRGIGAHGWGGIPPVTTVAEGRLVRPLLGVGRDAILAYAVQHGILFREDASNADPKYLRNRVRGELLPLMEDLRTGARSTLARASGLLRELHGAARMHLVREAQDLMPDGDGVLRIPLARVANSPAPRLFLLHLLQPAQPHPDLLEQLLEAVEQEATGVGFQVDGYQWTVERGMLARRQLPRSLPAFPIVLDQTVSGSAGPFTWRQCTPDQVDLGQGMNTAWLDLGKLKAPLELRPWRHGDRMRPIGLGGGKLVSDILIDDHTPSSRKAATYVLTSGQAVVWVVGHRMAEGYSPTAATRQVICVTRAPW